MNKLFFITLFLKKRLFLYKIETFRYNLLGVNGVEMFSTINNPPFRRISLLHHKNTLFRLLPPFFNLFFKIFKTTSVSTINCILYRVKVLCNVKFTPLKHTTQFTYPHYDSLMTKFPYTKNYTLTNYSNPQNLKGVNYLPILIHNNRVKNFFLKKNILTTFFSLQVSKFLNLPIFFRLECIKISTIFLNININLVLKKFKRYANFFGGASQQLEFVLTCFFTIITKDLVFFTGWLKKKFESIFYRKHKKLLYLVKLFFINYLVVYLPIFNCLGFFFKVRGKIGVGGNSKKKKYSIRLGKQSLTTKKLLFNSNCGSIRTLVGVLGFTIHIFYL